MTRRFWIGLALTLPVVVLAMGGHLLGLDHRLGGQTGNLLQLALATPVVLWAGWPFFQRGWQSLVTRNLNMFTLIAMGTGVAFIYSVVATIAPGIFPAGFRGPDGAVAVYFEAAAVITVLVLLGQVLELGARERTSGRDPRALGSRAADGAPHRRAMGGEEDVDIAAVAVGDRLRVRPGEKVAVDGVIEEGHSFIEEAMVTGEPMPVEKEPGGQSDRRHAQRDRQLHHAGREGRTRHAAGADRADGRASTAQPRPDPAAGRPDLRLVRAAGHRRCPGCLCRLGADRAATAPCLCAGRGGDGADHCLPVRARASRRRCRSWSASDGAPRPGC